MSIMKTSTMIGVIVALIIILGGAYWYWISTNNQDNTMSESTDTGYPSGAAGTNGSPNQGNLGGTDTGTPQQPSDTGGTASSSLDVQTTSQ